MLTNQAITSPDQLPKTGFVVVLVSSTWNGKRTLKFKGTHETRDAADAQKRALSGASCGEYRVLGPRQARALLKVIQGEQAARRAKGAQKAAATRKSRGPNNFVCCPTCGAKSKKLYSEMGGLQTRRCQNGHTFEYDKWIADRAFWAPVAAARAAFRVV